MNRETIAPPVGRGLRWTQPNALVRLHELRAGSYLLATLKWKKMFGSLAVGECDEGAYTFKRGGFLRPYVTVRESRSKSDFAVMRMRSGSVILNAVFGPSGTVEFNTGQRFSFDKLSPWRSRWAISDEKGVPLATFDRKMKGKPSAIVTLHSDFRHIPFLQVLLLLGWYVIILDYEEAEAAIGCGLADAAGAT